MTVLFSPSTAAQGSTGELRILTMADPFALVIDENRSVFEGLVGRPLDLELVGYTDLRQRILLNAFEAQSEFDLVAVDVGWAPEVARSGVVLSIDDWIAERGVDTQSYLAPALEGAMVNGQTIGLPIQPHAELLLYHRDLLRESGLEPPRTTDEVLSVATALYDAEAGIAGLCWNGEAGSPLGQTMLHLLAAFGGRPLDPNGRPTLDTPQMLEAIGYAEALMAVSPPGIANMALDERIDAFATRRCALTYAWTGRWLQLAKAGLGDPAGTVGVVAAPHAPGTPPVSPLGVWLLAIPANLSADRVPAAFEALVALTSLDANQILAANGVGTLVHAALLDDPDMAARNPALRVLAELEQSGELHSWMRPSIPQFQALTEILGTEVHRVLTGTQSAEDAARRSQQRFEALIQREGAQ